MCIFKALYLKKILENILHGTSRPLGPYVTWCLQWVLGMLDC